MQIKDYYATLGVPRYATPEDIKRAYRKLARKYHPDVSKLPDTEERFKEIGEAHEVLMDAEKRAAYDAVGASGGPGRHGAEFQPPPDWNSGFEFSGRDSGTGFGDHSAFFEALFGRQAGGRGARPGAHRAATDHRGQDHHAKVQIDLEDAYQGARRSITLRFPVMDEQGRVVLAERQIEVTIPKGVREGQHLRLAGQGEPGAGGAPAGDLFLEIALHPHPLYRVDGRDVRLDLPVAPWEAALGADVDAPTPLGVVRLTVPPGSTQGRSLRLKGRGIPGEPPGDLYAQLRIVLPPADTDVARRLYREMAEQMPFDPRAAMGTRT
jgi:curved DNA-binding protein